MKSDFINAMCKEIVLHKEFFNNNYIKTIYFGGGTPSVLSLEEWNSIFQHFQKYVDVTTLDEITVEVNPDDVSPEYINGLHKLGVNRVSMGIQSFVDTHLRKMNRRHNAQQANEAIEFLKQSPIKNVSIDLIYGLPYMTMDEWYENIERAINADVQHISAYHLTFEKGTPYYDLLKKGKLKEISEDQSSDQFDLLRKKLDIAGFENYEISNFAKPGFYSRHNGSYWTGDSYLGLGPSAHSFNGKSRRWNIRDIKGYTDKINRNAIYWEEEHLSPIDIYNERIMLGLRTLKGFEMDFINQLKDQTIRSFALSEIDKQIELNNIEITDGWCQVKWDRKLITDRIISDLFFTEED